MLISGVVGFLSWERIFSPDFLQIFSVLFYVAVGEVQFDSDWVVVSTGTGHDQSSTGLRFFGLLRCRSGPGLLSGG